MHTQGGNTTLLFFSFFKLGLFNAGTFTSHPQTLGWPPRISLVCFLLFFCRRFFWFFCCDSCSEFQTALTGATTVLVTLKKWHQQWALSPSYLRLSWPLPALFLLLQSNYNIPHEAFNWIGCVRIAASLKRTVRKQLSELCDRLLFFLSLHHAASTNKRPSLYCR